MPQYPTWQLALLAAATACLGSSLAFAAHPVKHRPASARTTVAPAALAGNPAQGAKLYQACMGCHSLDSNEVGPRHRGVVGRAAGTVPGYAYSAALRNSKIVWTPARINRWLTNPQKLVPGAKMFFSVAKPQDRADIIAYLAQQK